MMASLPACLLHLLIFFFASLAEANDLQKIYLVRMKLGSHGYGSGPGHQALLGEVLDEDSTVADALIYSYTESFTGFAARLTETERQKLERRREVLSVSPSRSLKLHTTRSWDFLNLDLKAKREVEVESNMVVAVLDTGIWPHSEVFSDKGMSPAPPGWENKCEQNVCNNKIIGARSYYTGHWPLAPEEKQVIDLIGHGTHVASIVAGRETKDASFYGLAKGTLRGGVPNVRIAVYKICWKVIKKENHEPEVACPEHDTLKAIDDAINDEVDIISYSQGSEKPIPLHKDNVAWAFLRATGKGILTVASAGNNGAGGWYTVTNGAPWILTVAASDTDRKFTTFLELEGAKNKLPTMNTINPFETQDSFYPLVEETFDKPARTRELIQSREGLALSDRTNDKGKDVFFNLTKPEQVKMVFKEKAKGLIINVTRDGKKCQFPLPCVCLIGDQAKALQRYVKSNRNHLAKIHKSEDNFAPNRKGPLVAGFSSRGPNRDKMLSNVLKPDITAPGLDILAGWSKEAKLVDGFPQDNRVSEFNIQSGTSMSCPHATAVALYLKSFNPSWSPGAIKSALMTTSRHMNRGPNAEFAYGAGHLNASRVLNPGLVYDTLLSDYNDFLCKQGYSFETLKSQFGSEEIGCSETRTRTDLGDHLNYPTMSSNVSINTRFNIAFYRTVTNDGSATSTYEVDVHAPDGFEVVVKPERLSFSYLHEKKCYEVNVIGTSTPNAETTGNFLMPETWITWSDGEHIVRSPIVIYSIRKEYDD